MRRSVIIAGFAAVAVLTGCAALSPRVRQSAESPAAVASDVQQVAGPVGAVARDMTGYHSEFGLGATLVVSLALLLALVLSHRREVLRIRRGGRFRSEDTTC